ncbi:hypothetical protein [Planococcus salinus]|uniref:OmpH family outer membrane protein n=1 Tax=Planococcus salinus TaxID=1848460 RepID=A0A3M8P8U8_9BACL|nr:hypothetical protein [Planococcus salinus]RNF39680.1 hypothetical protein EEX84_06820 [Planococcus salinus]
MFKKGVMAFGVSLALILSAGAPGFAAGAETNQEVEKALSGIEKTNNKIDFEIEKNESKADRFYAHYKNKSTLEKNSAKQERLQVKYQQKRDKLIADLRVKAEKMTVKEISKASKAGVETEIYLTPGQFGDVEALIDPIRVIGW